MKEHQVSRWARNRVASHLLTGIVNPVRARSAATVMYRALKSCAAQMPRASLSGIFPGIEQVEVRVKYSPDMGGGSLSDVITLAQVVKFLGCQRIFEIGTFRGYTTFHLALNTPTITQWRIPLLRGVYWLPTGSLCGTTIRRIRVCGAAWKSYQGSGPANSPGW